MADPHHNPHTGEPDRAKGFARSRRPGFLTGSFLGANAALTILILTLITVFFIKESTTFVISYHKSLQQYRASGLEFVDIMNQQYREFTDLARFLDSIRADRLEQLDARAGKPSRTLTPSADEDALAKQLTAYRPLGEELYTIVREAEGEAIAFRELDAANTSLSTAIRLLETYLEAIEAADGESLPTPVRDDIRQRLGSRQLDGADAAFSWTDLTPEQREVYRKRLLLELDSIRAEMEPVDHQRFIEALTGRRQAIRESNQRLAFAIHDYLARLGELEGVDTELEKRLQTFAQLNQRYLLRLEDYERRLDAWDPDRPVPLLTALRAFLTGDDWITASAGQDSYGLLPLLSGSLLVSLIGLGLAVPFAVGAAVFTCRIAGPREHRWIRSYFELLSVIPSVVLGLFGVMVLGEAIRWLSALDALAWIPFFPFQERLNAFTAGVLLAIMVVPTIYSMSVTSIERIPKNISDASFALGATHLQTTLHVALPSSMPGIIAAVMIGFGRVIGETMIVLLCAGNRIEIPDFSKGVSVLFEPVHTMTGVIAQEMGEVVQNSIHYRSLFMVGVVLFFVSLIVNVSALWVVRSFARTDR